MMNEPKQTEEAQQMETESASPARKSQPLSARARAEARRRRILQKSKDRMSVVSGDTKQSMLNDSTAGTKKNSEEANVSPSPVASEDATEGSSKNEGPDTEDTATPTTPTPTPAEKNENTSKGSARLAQMRRRRYKKATGADASAPPSVSQTGSTTVDNDAAGETQKNEINGGGNIVSTENVTADSSESKSGTTDEAPAGKKKYLGVVKMRRKMLAEKKASEAQATEASSTNATPTKLKTIKKEKNTVSLRPIIVQLLTGVLLVLSGFDVGLQNHVIVKQETPSVHSNFALSDHGLGALKLVGMNTPSQRPNDIIIEDNSQLNNDINIENQEEEFVNVEAEEEEFAEVKPAGVSTSSTKEPNIDPLFKVDLDELTAGDGFLMAAARMAVAGHRMITYLFFTLPLSFIGGLFSLPKRIFVNPPILFICAVVIRYLGKHVFGGSIPDFDKMIEAEISESEAMKSKEGVAEGIANTDFVSMGTNFVKNFIKSNFPRAVLVYTIFQDARSDMFVVFCGFFLGLVVPINLVGYSIPSSVSEEL